MKFKFLFLSLLVAGIGIFLLYKPKEKKTSFHPITEKKPFVIIIPSYNNSEYVEKNLTSVFTQKYDNYRVIYIDDHSNDNTLKNASEIITKLDKTHSTTLIHNPTNQGSLSNIYNAVHSCHDNEIIVLLDGDDFLAHENVLSTLNQIYADSNIWLTYGNYLDYPSFKQQPHICKALPKKTIQNNLYRKKPWVTSHLRSFYASLFKQIKLEDLFYRGRFYAMSGDLAFMFPMLELAQTHIHFIKDILYLYNRQNPISDHKINLAFQQECADHIRSRAKYTSLQKLPHHYPKTHKSADLVIFSKDRPIQLFAFIESVQRFVKNTGKIHVFFEASSVAFNSGYQQLKAVFPQMQFIDGKNDFKSKLTQLLFYLNPMSNDHVLFAHDQLIIKDFIDLSDGVQILEQTKGYGLFYAYHENLKYSKDFERYQPLPPQNPLRGLSSGIETPFAWQFSSGSDDWNTPCNFQFTLYSKEALKKLFTQIDYDSPTTLMENWGENSPQNAVGLFYKTGKCARIAPLKSLSTIALLDQFEDGLKIDITPYFQLSSPSQEITTTFSFIPRD